MAYNDNSDQDEFAIHGINVTPFVDIMLVLLVIFMVTATYIVKEAIEIELPKAASGGETTAKTLAISITKDGTIYLDGAAVTDLTLVEKIEAEPGNRDEMQAVIGADRDALHGSVVRVLDILKTQGITKFAIQIQKTQ